MHRETVHLSLAASCINLWHDHTSKKAKKKADASSTILLQSKSLTDQHASCTVFLFPMVTINWDNGNYSAGHLYSSSSRIAKKFILHWAAVIWYRAQLTKKDMELTSHPPSLLGTVLCPRCSMAIMPMLDPQLKNNYHSPHSLVKHTFFPLSFLFVFFLSFAGVNML